MFYYRYSLQNIHNENVSQRILLSKRIRVIYFGNVMHPGRKTFTRLNALKIILYGNTLQMIFILNA